MTYSTNQLPPSTQETCFPKEWQQSIKDLLKNLETLFCYKDTQEAQIPVQPQQTPIRQHSSTTNAEDVTLDTPTNQRRQVKSMSPPRKPLAYPDRHNHR